MNGWQIVSMIASLISVAFAWRAWVNSSDARKDLDDLRYKLRRELGSDGL